MNDMLTTMRGVLHLFPLFWLSISAFLLVGIDCVLIFFPLPVTREYHDPLTELLAVAKAVGIMLVRMVLLDWAWMLERQNKHFQK
jgi:hypothetical protein